MIGSNVMELLLAGGLAASISCVVVLRARVRRLARRLESMTRPTHELRGALTALQLGLDAADRPYGRFSAALAERTAGLRMQVERATLALGALERCRDGRTLVTASVRVEHFDLAAMVLHRGRAWAQLAAGFGSRLEVDWRAGPVSLQGEPDRLSEALDNLIANALEHGGGRVLVEGEREGARVRLTISDGGPGPGRLPTPSTTDLPRLGRGQGLAIAREAVDAHGGRLTTGVGANGAALVVELPVENAGKNRAGGWAGARRRAA